MCEPLRRKVWDLYNTGHPDDTWVFLRKDVRSAVELYKEYRYSEYDLKENHPNIYNKYDTMGRGKSWTNWFFDYCFGDVTNE